MKTSNKTQVKTIDVNAREWFDKVNGNSYFAGSVTVNFGYPDSFNLNMPFQYGYGDSYTYAAIKLLNEAGYTEAKWLQDLRNQNIILRYNIQRGCKKRDLKNY